MNILTHTASSLHFTLNKMASVSMHKSVSSVLYFETDVRMEMRRNTKRSQTREYNILIAEEYIPLIMYLLTEHNFFFPESS